MVDSMSTTAFTRFDAADYLVDIKTAVAYLQATIDESGDDPGAIAEVLGAIARSGNLSELARRTGMSREGLYKALSADGNPSFATIVKVARALGLTISFRAKA
jgi:probable addiction module antidote protein